MFACLNKTAPADVKIVIVVLGYTKTAAPFARSGCFKAANDFLEEISRGPVDWDL